MRPFRHRITASIAGLAYLLASALSGSLHSHSHGEMDAQHDCVALVGEHQQHAVGHDDHLSDLSGKHEDAPCPQPLSDDDCAACRFVAQPALFCVPTVDLTPAPAAAEVRVVAPSIFIEPIYSSGLARAPPLV